MAHIAFKVRGLKRRTLRQIRYVNIPKRSLSRTIFALSFIAAGIYLAGSLLPAMTAVLSGSPVVVIDGEYLIAEKIALILDVSGSMKGTENKVRQIETSFKSAAINVSHHGSNGFGVSDKGSPDNLLHLVERALAATPGLDTVYAFSDFEVVNSNSWRSDPDGHQRIATLLARHRVRLYLGSVRHLPPVALARVAIESGGGMIQNTIAAKQ